MLKRQESITTVAHKHVKATFKIPLFVPQVMDRKILMQSSNITTGNLSGSMTWVIAVSCQPGKDGSRSNDTCFGRLRLVKAQPSFIKPFNLNYSFGVLSRDGTIELSTPKIRASSSDLILLPGNGIEIFTRKKLMSNKSLLLVDNELSIVCQIEICGDIESDGYMNGTEGMPDLPMHLKSFFGSGFLSDVTILADGDEIRAHKCIISRSPVFRAMFESKMSEEKTGVIRADKFSVRIMRALLFYMYTDKVEDLDGIVGDLFIAADYYDLPGLKDTCTHSLAFHVTATNFAQSFYIAERYGIESVRAAVVDFISANRKTIRETPGWQELAANSELLTLVLTRILHA